MANGNEFNLLEALEKLKEESQFEDVKKTAKSDGPGGFADFAGNLVWGFGSSFTFGAPDVLAETFEPVGKFRSLFGADDNEGSFAGSAGYIIGTGLGMINPIKWATKGVSWGLRGIRSFSKGYGSKRAGQIGDDLVSKFDDLKDAGKMHQAYSTLGKEGLESIVKQGDEVLGFGKMNPFAEKRFAEIAGNSARAWDEAVVGIREGVKKVAPELGDEVNEDLSRHLLSSMLKHNPGDMHKVINNVVSKIPYLGQGRKGEIVAAIGANFATGVAYHTATEAVQNAAVMAMENTGHEIDETAASHMHSLWRNKTGVDFLKGVTEAGIGFGVLGPAHYIRGGRTRGLLDEGRVGLKNMSKTWKRLGKMSDDEARARLTIIEDNMKLHGDTSLRALLNYKGANIPNWTKTLSGKEAKNLLYQARKYFHKEWLGYYTKEAGKDIIGSSPRMLLGASLMQLHGMYDQYKHGARGMDLVGDPKEFATHMMMGAVFAKRGRAFSPGRKLGFGGEKVWQTTPAREVYTNAPKHAEAINRGLAYLGVEAPIPFTSEGGYNKVIRSAMENTGEWGHVKQTIDPYYVEVAKNIPGAKPLRQAYLDGLRAKGEKLTPERERDIENTIKVVEAFDKLGPERHLRFREVTPGEALEIVEMMKNAPDIGKFSNNIEGWIENANIKSQNAAAQMYIDPINGFFDGIMRSLNLTMDIDPNTNKVILPDIKLDKLLNDMPRTEYKEPLRRAIDTYNRLVEMGVNDGQVEISGRETISAINRNQAQAMIETFNNATAAMLQTTYGQGITSSSAALPNMDILIDPVMRLGYRDIKAHEQVNNFLEALEPVGKVEGLFSTLQPNVKAKVQELMEKLRLDKTTEIFEDQQVNPENQAEAVATYTKLKEVYNSATGDAKGGKPIPLPLSEVQSVLNELFGRNFEGQRKGGVFGDLITNDVAFNNLNNAIGQKFLQRLRLVDAESPFSTLAATQYLLNGSVKEKASGEFGTAVLEPQGLFATKTKDGYILPESNALFGQLEATFKGDPVALQSLREFYTTYQNDVKSAGGVMRFTANTESVKRVVDLYGTEGVVDLLNATKVHSDIGKIKGLLADADQINRSNIGLEKNIADQRVTGEISGQLSELLTFSKVLGDKFSVARREGNLSLLLALEAQTGKMSFSRYMKELEAFSNINPETEGYANTAYKKRLSELLLESAKLNDIDYTVNSENLTDFIRTEVAKQSKTLPDKIHEMEITITPNRFSQKYGILESQMNNILDKAYSDYYISGLDGTTIQGDIGIVKKAYNDLKAETLKTSELLREPINQVELTTDVIQMVSSRLFKKRAKKLSLVERSNTETGLLEMTDTFILPHKTKGIDGIDNIFKLGGDWYELNSDITTISPITGRPIKEAGFGSNAASIEADLLAGRIGFRNKREELQLLQEQIDLTDVHLNKNEQLVRVTIGEKSYLYPLEKTKAKVQEAYAEDGGVYEVLKKILPNTKEGNARLKELSKEFTGEINADKIADAIDYAWTVLNRPELILETSQPLSQALKIAKQLKISQFDRGKMLTQDYYDFLNHSYGEAAGISPTFKAVSDLLKKIGGSDGRIDNKKQKFASINDDVGTLSLRYIAEKIYSRYAKEGIMTQSEALEAVSNISEKLSAVDAPTFVTKETMLLELAKIGVRPEMLTFEKGEITGFKTGAVKPKGHHAEVKEDGSISVMYNKTAFFYEPTLGKFLSDKGLNGVMFKSGNKVNFKRVAKGEPVPENYIESPMHDGNSMIDIIKESISTSGKVTEVPYEATITMNVAKEHLGTVGSNTGIHFPHSAGIDKWIGTEHSVREFKDLLTHAKKSDYSAAAIIEQLMSSGLKRGDSQFAKVPFEQMIQESGMVLQPHLRDLALDKLFSYFFSGGKVAMSTVPNSSYNAMMPDILTPFSAMELPIRLNGSQRTLGHYAASDMDLRSTFKKFGANTTDNKVAEVGTTFATRIKFGDVKADAVIIPNRGEIGVMVDGWFIDKTGVKDITGIKNRTNKLTNEESTALLKDLEAKYDAIIKDIGNNATYSDVLTMLESKHSDFNMVNAQVRQPRNTMNDFLITKVIRSNAKESGSSSSVNPYDLAKTQDADADFDKSNSYMSTPGDVIKHALANGGKEVTTDSHKWADQMIANLRMDFTDPVGGSKNLKDWLSDHNNAELARGQFVKLHNVASYFLNAMPNAGKIGSINIDNSTHTIRVRANNEYTKAVSEIAQWVKKYIDSYEKPMETLRVGDMLDRLLLGEPMSTSRPQGEKRFEGIFEIVDKDGNPQVITDPYIRKQIKYNFINPLKRYLRYNRGVSPEEMSRGFTLKDASEGYKALMYDIGGFGKPGPLYTETAYKTEAMAKYEKLDLSEGMTRLQEYIQRESKNPFDLAMRQLFEANSHIEGLNIRETVNEVNGIIKAAEAEVLRGYDKTGSKEQTVNNLSNKLWEFVQKDGNYVKLVEAQRRLNKLKEESEYRLAEERPENAKSKKDREERISVLSEVISEMEFRIGADLARMEGRPAFKLQNRRKEGELVAFNEPLVVWDQSGKIKEVIKVGQGNSKTVEKTDSIVQGGRRFELADPKSQQYLKARHLAFNDVPFILEGNGNQKALDMGGAIVVDKAYEGLKTRMSKHKADLMAKRIGVDQYSTYLQKELHNALNGGYELGINNSLLRKGLIWKLLAPKLDYNVVTMQKGLDGKYVYDNKFFENKMDVKAVEQYLTGLATETKFTKGTLLRPAEAVDLMREIAQRQALASIGLSNPEIKVQLDLGLTGSRWFERQIRKDIELNPELYKAKVENTEALEILSDVITKGRLVNPFDLRKIVEAVDAGIPPTDIIRVIGPTHKRHYGSYGRVPMSKETINEGLRRMGKELREGCK